MSTAAAKPAAAPAAAAPKPAADAGPTFTNVPPPVHNLAVESEVVPKGRRRQSVIAGGVTKTENLIDLTNAKVKKADEPNFFVLVSETSLFAGVPNTNGAVDGPALMAKFNTPSDIVVDRNQQLFVADTDNARIRRISKQGMVSTVAAIGGGDGDIENFPHGLAFDLKGAMYILQSGLRHQIFQVAPGAGVKLLAGTDEKGHKDSMTDLLHASFNHPRATGVDSQNRIYICDKGNNAVRRLDIEKQTVITLLGPGGVPLDLLNPEGIVVDQYDDVFIADTGHHRILKVSFITNEETGNEETEVSNYCGKYGVASYGNGPAANSFLHSPTGLAIDKQNHLWICDSGNNCIRMMAHGAELLFTVSGKGSAEQERQYNYPTSIALSYDAMYGADMADSAPDAVRTDPTHPLYYSYITPVIFVADSGSHCIRKIHTVMMESAKALIDVCTPAVPKIGKDGKEEEEDFPMHNALSYGVTNQRNGLMSVLLQLKPQLLQQKDREGRLPLHIACMESQTSTAGTISMDTINRMLGMAQPNAISAIMTEDKHGKIPIAYALEQMQAHTMNVASEKLERGEDDEPDVDNPDLPWDASRHLLNAMLSLAPSALNHPSCAEFTLHTLIASGVPLKFLKKFTQAIEDAREDIEAEGMLDSAFTTVFELKAAALAKFPNPFFVRDNEGKLPIHVAAAMHQQGTPVALDVLQWLVLVSQLPPQMKGAPRSERWRDQSLKTTSQKKPILTSSGEVIEGHHPMFYACVLPRAAAPNAAPGGPQLHKPLHKIPKEQVACIEYLLDAWPESILQNEAAGVLHQSPFQATSMKPITFLEWVFYHRSLELLEIFCRRMPQCLDRFIWLDSQDMITPAESDASVIGKDGKRKRRNSAGPNTLTMLHSAARIGDAEMLEVVLKNTANPFIGDKRDKLPIDYAEDPACKKLLQEYMDKDPRKPVPQMVTMEIGTQTGADEEALAEKARQEAEAKRLLEKEAELAALLTIEREAARVKAEEEAAARAAELAATQARLAAEAEAEKQRLAAEAEAEKQRLATEAEAEKQRLIAEAEAEKQRLAAELAAEKERLQADSTARELAQLALEDQLRQAAENERIRLAQETEAEKQRLQQEAEAERQRQAEMAEGERQRLVAEAEAEKQRLAEVAEAERQRLAEETEAEKQRLAQETELEKQRLAAEADAERARLAQLESEKDQARELSRQDLEEQLRQATEAERQRLAQEAELEKQRLAHEAELEKQRLAQEVENERARLAQLEVEKDQAREQARLELEEQLRQAAEQERNRLAHEAEEERQRLAQLEAEKDAARAQLEAELRQAEADRVAAAAQMAEEARQAELARQEAQRQLEAELAAVAEADRARIQAEAEAERERLAQIDAEREAARLQLEAELRAQAEADAQRTAELQAQLQAEADAERQRVLADAEEERARLTAEAAEKDAARAALELRLQEEAEAERQRLQAEAHAEQARLAQLDAEREAARVALEAEMHAADEAREAARLALEAQMREADAAREAARIALEEQLRQSAEEQERRRQEELEAERSRLAAIEAERAAAAKQAEEEAAERERLRVLKNQKLQEQRDASRAAAEAADAAKAAAEEAQRQALEEAARVQALLEATNAAKAEAEAAAAAAEAARLAAEADAEEARRRREHQWNLNAEHEERLRREQEAAIAAQRPTSASKDLGDLKRLPQKKKQSAAELAQLARAQAAIEAAAAKRNAPKKVLGFGSSALKTDTATVGGPTK